MIAATLVLSESLRLACHNTGEEHPGIPIPVFKDKEGAAE
jgi:hypothetical protein